MLKEEESRFAELLSKMLAAFQWAVYKKYGATKADFAELYLLIGLKLKEKDGMRKIEDQLRRLGLEIDCGEI